MHMKCLKLKQEIQKTKLAHGDQVTINAQNPNPNENGVVVGELVIPQVTIQKNQRITLPYRRVEDLTKNFVF